MSNPNSFASQVVTETAPEGESRSRQTVVRDDQGLVSTAPPVEKALLVGVEIFGQPAPLRWRIR